MEKTYVFEGKTTNEAIEKGLKELKVSKNKVDIKVLDTEEKRSFFSILTPRVVKVEMTLKEGNNDNKEQHKEHNKVSKEIKEEKKENKEHKPRRKTEFDHEEVKKRLEKFLDEFIKNQPKNELKYEIKFDEDNVLIVMDGKDTGYLIGYRGEVLNSLQEILTTIASKGEEGRVRVQLDISGYREKRKVDLENLADKIARSVIKNQKSITIEPMSAYERKIIHLRLQDNDKVITYSIGEEPYRKIVVSLKK